MASKEHLLLMRAAEHFPNLTDAEKNLLHAVIGGGVADCSSRNDAENDPRQAHTWNESRTIRAKVIRWLCVDPETIGQMDPHGINIYAATIKGRLDLAYMTISVPLTLSRCALKAGVTLEYANTRTLKFSGSVLGTSGETPLDASGARVSGDTFLNNSFEAEGEVRLLGASIGGDLVCTGGTFHHPNGDALSADRAKVGGSVTLDNGFRAEGEVRLLGASIGGNLVCTGGMFQKGNRQERHALNADRVQVTENAYLNDKFRAEGEVRLLGASIGGDLVCTEGTFHHPTGVAFGADRVQVGRAVFLGRGFRAEGTVRFVNGHAGPLQDDETSWPAPGNLRLDGFVYTAIAENPPDITARLKWLARQPSRPFKPQPYLQLAKVLRESGREADAKRVLIAKERARRTHGGLWWGARGWNWLLAVTIRYGYQPWLALIWAGGFVAVGGMFFGWGYEKDIVIPTKAEAYDSEKKTRQEPAFYPAFNRWLYALDTFVPIINFGQKDYWGPQVACNRPGLISGGGVGLCLCGMRALYLYRCLHIVAGWVLITLVVTGFTNLVRRE